MSRAARWRVILLILPPSPLLCLTQSKPARARAPRGREPGYEGDFIDDEDIDRARRNRQLKTKHSGLWVNRVRHRGKGGEG